MAAFFILVGRNQSGKSGTEGCSRAVPQAVLQLDTVVSWIKWDATVNVNYFGSRKLGAVVVLTSNFGDEKPRDDRTLRWRRNKPNRIPFSR